MRDEMERYLHGDGIGAERVMSSACTAGSGERRRPTTKSAC